MIKITLLVSVLSAIILQLYSMFTDDWRSLGFELVDMLVAYICSMMILMEK